MFHVFATAMLSILAAAPLGEELEFIARVPEVEGLKSDTKIGYYYKTHAVGLWTSGGRFVLYRNEIMAEYVEPTHQQWVQILGKHPETIYPIPWSYRVPAGWIVIGGVFAFGAVLVLRDRWKSNRETADPLSLKNLKQDEQIAAGMSHYIQACSEAGMNPFAAHPELFAESVSHLAEEYGVEPEYAASGLGVLLQHMAILAAEETQESAARLEAGENWSEARDAYEAAAEQYDSLNAEHAEFIRRECIGRVEKKIDPFAE